MPSFSVCVYCGARSGVAPHFTEAARAVGRWIGQQGGELVYGGGSGGLMGAVAQSTLEAGGRVVGIIPASLVEREWAKRDCTELHVVDSMHARKHMMAERAQAFLALPGGIGTFEELFEAWTWRQLGFHAKPVGLLDVEGYYRPLQAFLASAVAAGFMNEGQMALLRTGADPAALLEALRDDARKATGAQDLSQI